MLLPQLWILCGTMAVNNIDKDCTPSPEVQATVQGRLFQPLCRGLNIESLAEWTKSGKESG
jgi:hypothetical protein